MTIPLSVRRSRLSCSLASAAYACWLLFLVLFPTLLRAEPICLEVETGGRRAATLPVTLGSEVLLSFRHSLYDALVQEEFHVRRDGLQITRIRYGEQRLAEFYGHEAARYERGWWVVEPERRQFPILNLRASPDSSIQISSSSKTIALRELVETGGPVRLTVTACRRENDER